MELLKKLKQGASPHIRTPRTTAQIMTELSATGGIMLIALSFSMLDFMKVKVANMMPALIFPVLIIILFL